MLLHLTSDYCIMFEYIGMYCSEYINMRVCIEYRAFVCIYYCKQTYKIIAPQPFESVAAPINNNLEPELFNANEIPNN